jgi:hypothetical protein
MRDEEAELSSPMNILFRPLGLRQIGLTVKSESRWSSENRRQKLKKRGNGRNSPS